MNERYSRQILFPKFGEQGQYEISQKHVLIIGAGALGTGNAEILTRAGIGKMTIVDRDYVEWSNLQRQQLYTEDEARQRIPKAIAAKKRLQQINSQVDITAHILDVIPETMEQLITGVDLIIDATDNFDIRMIINDISQKYQIPWIYGSCVGSYGISYTIIPGETPCLHCLMENVPIGGLTCDTAGIISPTVNMVVVHQSVEAFKLLIGDYKALRKKLIAFDLWKNEQSLIRVEQLKKENCSSCGINRTYPFLSYENQLKTAILCGRDTVQIRPNDQSGRDVSALAKLLKDKGFHVEYNAFLLSLEVDKQRLVMFQDGRTLVHGTKDIHQARTLYHQYLA